MAEGREAVPPCLPIGVLVALVPCLCLHTPDLIDECVLHPVQRARPGVLGFSLRCSTYAVKSCSLPGPQFPFVKSGPACQTQPPGGLEGLR